MIFTFSRSISLQFKNFNCNSKVLLKNKMIDEDPSQKDIDKKPLPGYTKVNMHFGLIDKPKRRSHKSTKGTKSNPHSLNIKLSTEDNFMPKFNGISNLDLNDNNSCSFSFFC